MLISGLAMASAAGTSARSMPTIEVAPGVFLPTISMGGVLASSAYPDPSNYSLVSITLVVVEQKWSSLLFVCQQVDVVRAGQSMVVH
jgi:hypothetical protein